MRADMRSPFLAMSAVLIVLAGCAEAGTAPPQSGSLPEASSNATPTTDASAAKIAHVVCEKDAVRLQDPVVQAEQDGVHFLVENPVGASGIDLRHDS